MQECEKIRGLMLDYFDGRLDAQKTGAMQRHLDTCAQCRELFSDMEALLKAEKNLPKDTPDDLHERIMGAVRWDARIARLRTRSRRRGWIAAACACVVLFGAGTLSLLRMNTMKSDSAVNEMSMAYDAKAFKAEDTAEEPPEAADMETDGAENGASVPQEGVIADAGEAADPEVKSRQDALSQEALDAILSALPDEALQARIVVCGTQDLAALEDAAGASSVYAGGYAALLLDAPVFDALIAQGTLYGVREAQREGFSHTTDAKVLVLVQD